jgi:hypothetical protein
LSSKKFKSIDDEMRYRIKFKRNLSVPWYLMASYAYYELDNPILTDASFDELGKFMLSRWEAITHRHKHLITEDDLRAGTLLRRDFPEIVKSATLDLIQRRNK